MTQALLHYLSFWTDEKTEALIAAARAAGAATLEVRAAGGLDTQTKGDGSPVTVADHASQAIILEALARLTPEIPVIAEEKEIQPQIAVGGAGWFVDPLDGTREYVRGGPEYSVNIGLLIDGRPVLGLVYAPALDDLVFGAPETVFRARGTQRSALYAPQAASLLLPPRMVTSAREGKRLPIENWTAEGLISNWRICHSAYKLALVAGGDEDVFLRAGITYEWDTCAGHAILRALGGHILTPDGDELTYGKPAFRNGDYLCFRPDLQPETIALFLGKLRDLGSPVAPKGFQSRSF